ncbi:hypothetical protein K1T71_008569 [Dendrolimus kikuchii]|uniref:Uncharacterized protein n=1 Tax=Dendrolimus kikuchii TaxID=765133 RepID=A0ACC1CUX8_9NEOP|nr:hypothetical protein K1T71_008569 [Dendrolimus kikuchii]
MALMKSNTVPKDAVVLSEAEAIKYIWDIIIEWDSLADTWALRYASGVLGGINAVSGVLINRHYRHKFRLGSFGYLASVIPLSLMPGMLTTLFHRHFVTTDMLLMKQEACPICLEVRSAAIQGVMGVVYPTILASSAGLMLAHRYSTYRIPDLMEGPKVMFNFVRRLTRPYSRSLATLGAFQLVASSVLTYYEMRNNLTIRKKLMEIEEKVTNEEKIKS